MESVIYHKCVSCKVLREESDFEVNKGKRRKSCLKCKRRRVRMNLQTEKAEIKGLLQSLESKIQELSVKKEQPLQEFVKNDCVDASKLTDFVESIRPIRLRQMSELIELIREYYLALSDHKRPFYCKNDELFVNLNEWKKSSHEILIALGETIADKCGNNYMKLEDDFVQELLTLSKI